LTLVPSRRLIVVTVAASVPRTFAIYLYNSRTDSKSILTAASGSATARACRSVRVLAHYDKVAVVAIVKRPRRGRYRAHKTARVLASTSIGRLLNRLAHCSAPGT
jgi:hypothetical protein